MANGNIKFEKMDGVGIITLDRPESRNSLTPDMVDEMGEAIEACKRNDVRSVLLNGTGAAFCSGADVKMFVEVLDNGGPEGLHQHISTMADALHTKVVLGLRILEKPVVAAINGVAAGAGFSLTLGCDIRYAAQSARFLMAYANIGATGHGDISGHPADQCADGLGYGSRQSGCGGRTPVSPRHGNRRQVGSRAHASLRKGKSPVQSVLG